MPDVGVFCATSRDGVMLQSDETMGIVGVESAVIGGGGILEARERRA